jgi:geranylgeranyl reductase family protein
MNVAIVGGGPAGAMAALRLARAGASVTIFDASHPREKPCGGGVTGRALALIADAVDVASLPAVVVKAAIVEEPDTTDSMDAADVTVGLTSTNATGGVSLVVISRAVFDKALLDAAVGCGAQLVAEKVLDVARTNRTMTVRTAHREHAADLILGADGANSLVRKKLARPFLRREISIAAGYFVHGAYGADIVIRSMTEQPGYLWSFPRPDHLAVGVCAPASVAATSTDLRRQSLAWIQALGLDRSSSGTRLEAYAWPIPSAGFNTADEFCAAGAGWMLLGDAAGLVDPLTREGIYYALLSGVWAAQAIAAPGGWRPEEVYARRLRHEMYPELSRAARLSGLFFSPRFSRLFVSALRESGPIRQVFADLVAGTQPYRGLRRRLLRTREWKLAGRAMQLAVADS